jgi:hypothetical protein
MTFPEAMSALAEGKRIGNNKGSIFWLEHDAKGRPVLMHQPQEYPKPVKHSVFSSEHFDPTIVWWSDD